MKAAILVALAVAIFSSGCAVVRDPISENKLVYTGWGNFDYVHERPIFIGEQQVGTETVNLHREINTKEVLLELGGLATAVGGALAVVIPLFL